MLARLPTPPVPSLRRLAPIVPLLLATALTIGAASLTSALGHAVLATDPAASSHVSSGTASGGQASPFERARDVLASGLPLPAQPALAPDGVRVMTASQFYDVTGDDLGAVLASMRQNGPRDLSGEWAANTAWTFRWSYQSALGDGCGVQSARVDLDLTYTFPRWTAFGSASPAVEDIWADYLSHVELHERGHGEIAQAAAGEIAQAMEQIPAQPTCPDLDRVVQAVVAERVDRHAQAQAAYDRETQHGMLQGAVIVTSR